MWYKYFLYPIYMCPAPCGVVCLRPDVSISKRGPPVHYQSNILQQTYLGDISKYLHLKFYLKCPLVHVWYNTFSVLEVLVIQTFTSHQGIGDSCQLTAELFTCPTYFRLSLCRTVYYYIDKFSVSSPCTSINQVTWLMLIHLSH